MHGENLVMGFALLGTVLVWRMYRKFVAEAIRLDEGIVSTRSRVAENAIMIQSIESDVELLKTRIRSRRS